MSPERQTTTRMSVRTDRRSSVDPLDPSSGTEAVFIATLNDIMTHETSGSGDAAFPPLFVMTDAAGEGASAAKPAYGLPGKGVHEVIRLS